MSDVFDVSDVPYATCDDPAGKRPITSVADVQLGEYVWVYAYSRWRLGRVTRVLRTRIEVAFRADLAEPVKVRAIRPDASRPTILGDASPPDLRWGAAYCDWCGASVPDAPAASRRPRYDGDETFVAAHDCDVNAEVIRVAYTRRGG